jgi:hypothetical protein
MSRLESSIEAATAKLVDEGKKGLFSQGLGDKQW